MKQGEHKLKMKWLRRIIQGFVLTILIAIPYLTHTPSEYSPSRIDLGHLPPPTISSVTGDTWSFSIGDFTLTHPIAFIEEVIVSKTFYIPFLISMLIPFIITLLLGKVFCSWMCPVGFMLELNQKVNQIFKDIGINISIKIRDFRYIILTLCLVFGFFFAFPLISIFDPPHVLGREFIYFFTHYQVSLSGVGLLVGIFLFEAFSTSRVLCNSICPSGGGLSLIGTRRLWLIKMDKNKCDFCQECNDICPFNLNPMSLAEDKKFNWVKCDNCGLCRDVCPTGAISYYFGIKGGNWHGSSRCGSSSN